MCNLYSVTKSQQAVRDLMRAIRDLTGNMPLATASRLGAWKLLASLFSPRATESGRYIRGRERRDRASTDGNLRMEEREDGSGLHAQSSTEKARRIGDGFHLDGRCVDVR